jgi:NitT/TauT family transport system substrate-binding protein
MRVSVVMIGLLLSLPACSPRSDADKSAAATAEQRKLRVSLPLHLSTAPLMIAQEEGFFRDEGLTVEFVPGLPHDESLVALVSGAIDVRPGPVSVGMLSAIAQGAKIRIVGSAGYLARDGCTFFGIVLRPGLDTTQSGKVKRMRASLDGSQRYVTHAMLAQRQLSFKNVEAVRLPEAVIERSLQSGAIDAAAVSEPALSRLAKTGARWLSAQDAAPDAQWSVIAFGDRLINGDHDVGVRFMRAYRRGIERYNDGKTDRNVAIIAKATGEEPEVIRSACWVAFQKDSRINWASIDAFQAFAGTEGQLERPVPQAQAWDSTFLASSDGVAVPNKR